MSASSSKISAVSQESLASLLTTILMLAPSICSSLTRLLSLVMNLVSQTARLSPLHSQLAAILTSSKQLLLQVSSSHTTTSLVHFSGLLWHHAQTSSLRQSTWLVPCVAMTTPTSMQHATFWPIYMALHNKPSTTREHPSAHWHSAIRAFLFLSFTEMPVMVLTSTLPSTSLDSSPVWLTSQSPGQATYNLLWHSHQQKQSSLLSLMLYAKQST